MSHHYAADYDKSIPVIKMNKSVEQQRQENSTCILTSPRYAVINMNQIKHQVGLVQADLHSLEHKIVAPYYIFNIQMRPGELSRL
jgi:hypothetical protein